DAAGNSTTSAPVDVLVEGNLLLWLKLDETSGTTASDASGSENDGSVSGAGWTSGKVGGALEFDGTDDYVDLGTMDVSGSEITLAGWFKIDDFDIDDGRIISKANGGPTENHWWMLSTWPV